LFCSFVCCLVLLSGAITSAQEGAPRVLAPGVMTTIESEPQFDESHNRADIVELLAVDADFDWAKDVRFSRDIWALEFSFKPVRMMWVDLPQADGTMDRKLVWYMVYSVTNVGNTLHPVKQENGTYTHESIETPITFLPQFLLVSNEYLKEYPDRVIPAAFGEIAQREDPNRKFYNSVDISNEPLEPGETRWGIAMWTNIDAKIDRFSVYVGGLTNAYRWTDKADAYTPDTPPGAARQMVRKVLKLNFWRPGDEFDQNEREIRLGIPGEVDSEWIWR
jgi:hypothetical protein